VPLGLKAGDSWAELEERMSRNISTATGGITIAFDQEGEGSEDSRIREVDVLKNVLLREEYIRRLQCEPCMSQVEQTRRGG
jgi:hypothetical protein